MNTPVCDSVTYTTTISWSSAVINDCHQTLPSAWRSQDWSSPWRPWQWWCWRPPCWPGPGPGTMTVYTPCSELPDSPQPIFTSRSWGKGNSHIIPSHESSKFLIQLLIFFPKKLYFRGKMQKKIWKTLNCWYISERTELQPPLRQLPSRFHHPQYHHYNQPLCPGRKWSSTLDVLELWGWNQSKIKWDVHWPRNLSIHPGRTNQNIPSNSKTSCIDQKWEDFRNI